MKALLLAAMAAFLLSGCGSVDAIQGLTVDAYLKRGTARHAQAV